MGHEKNQTQAQKDIATLLRKHGPNFYTAIQHLFTVGCQHITEETVAACKAEITAAEEHGIPIMTKEYRCMLMDITLELTRFEIWDLLAFVKGCLPIGYEEET